MSINVTMDQGEKCVICGKTIKARDATVFYFKVNVIAGAWHARCGPLPHVEGLTTKPHHQVHSNEQ